MSEKPMSSEELEQSYANATINDDAAPEDSAELPPELQQFVAKLFNLARNGGPDAAEHLVQYVEAGLSPNLTNHEGNSLLMLAAYNGHADIVTALAKVGADVDRLNDRGQSPLAGAIFKKETAVVEALIDAGANPLAGHPDAIACADMFGQTELAERLRALAG
ncbi:MAG: ankyrin repeat domain-containing protein [Corynebacterium sp.]|uniref:ankyrin repeat domain-containing protein n=1 Tax=Corynebacterium sp. TaxID=1720 RepID=UPI0026DCE99C|nr:ankyrin repeat domain-containing protein [Corynebacterium sp.]MDO5099473.1 ankyrin repeat domain-containing protein [Corynebacterium sp.]